MPYICVNTLILSTFKTYIIPKFINVKFKFVQDVRSKSILIKNSTLNKLFMLKISSRYSIN